ncbi:MAG TPA: glycosyltransferase family 4 protein [Vicinamibacterales bacterium]
MKILVATDAFPPLCGGSGWSTFELARGLRARGHDITVVRPRQDDFPLVREIEYDGFSVREFPIAPPKIPYVRNYYKSERLTRLLGLYLADLATKNRYDIVHAQHVMTALPSIAAARRTGVPVVVTVRDYWPVCYWSDLLHTKEGLELCPECTVSNMMECIRPRAGAAWPLAIPLIPYMRANLARKRVGLASADAVIAVSRRIAADLAARAPELAGTRIHTIPNPVNVSDLRALAAASPTPTSEPYALYLGKLAPNKGTSRLVDVVERSRLDWPLVIVGDGPDRRDIEHSARRSGRTIEIKGWLPKDEAARWLAHASLLIFPSRGPESLSRVLIEASALGVPIAAMETGGTRDIIEPGVTGLLSATPEQLADDVRRLREDPVLRKQLGDAARLRVEREFDAPSVVARIEQLYAGLLARK